ncbi:uncharacterized protein LOC130894939 isoform X3 [Diorhabda carinulata]|uniref:uncharacterized protein LOC130894939 isoform X3 n=1 Tax=Diorhabda carinulata TaxID=1163345 RepID=UPI0025A2FF06|nr:uncharacterized protein LOC130894939 isoform X3 [Diorhabda carinulata]
MKQFSSVSDPALSLNNNLEINDIVSSRLNPSGSTSYEKQDFNGNHRHFHKLIISPDVKFDFHSELKVIRSTMYEPVLDRCVTTTIIKPKRHSIDDVCIYDSTNKISQDSPPEKPSRRQNKFSKHIYSQKGNESPRELAQAGILAKIQKDLSVELAAELKKNEDQPELWSSLIHTYFEKHEKVFLEAVGAGFGEGGGGNIWTYPGCVLFAVSLLTTLGFGAPVPRTPLGRGVAVLFAAIGIPLHFLLILNMGNLGSIRLQQLAYRNCLTEVPSTPKPKWLKFFPLLSIVCYYILGVILFGVVRQRQPIDCLMFPLDFTAAGGVATVEGKVRIFYALYLELAMTLAATIVSLLQASASRGIVDIGLKLGLLTNT